MVLLVSPAACKAVIDELKYSVSKEDPKKTIEVRLPPFPLPLAM